MREPGFYWVRHEDEYGGDWTIAWWGTNPMFGELEGDEHEWWSIADEIPCTDEAWAEIGEKVLRLCTPYEE